MLLVPTQLHRVYITPIYSDINLSGFILTALIFKDNSLLDKSGHGFFSGQSNVKIHASLSTDDLSFIIVQIAD